MGWRTDWNVGPASLPRFPPWTGLARYPGKLKVPGKDSCSRVVDVIASVIANDLDENGRLPVGIFRGRCTGLLARRRHVMEMDRVVPRSSEHRPRCREIVHQNERLKKKFRYPDMPGVSWKTENKWKQKRHLDNVTHKFKVLVCDLKVGSTGVLTIFF